MSSEKKPILSDDKGEELAIDIPQDDPSPSVPKSKKSPKAKVEVVVDIEHTSSPEPPSKDNKEEEIGHSPSPESKIHKRSPRIAADDEEKGLPPTQEPKAHKKILPKATEKKGIKQPPKQKIHHKRSSPESIVEEIENDPSTSNLKIHEKVSPKAKEISHPPISQPNVRKENSPKPSKKDDGNKSDEYLPPEAITDNKGKVVKVINPLIPEQESHKESSRKASKENDDSKAEEAKGNSDDEDDLKMDVLQKDDLKLKFKRHSSSQDSSGGDSVSYEYTIEEDFNVTEDYAEKQSGISSQSFRLPQYTKDNAQLLISCCRRNGRACKVFCFSFNAYYQSLFIFLVIILYLLMGAYVFEKLEEKTEMQRMVDAGKNTTNAMTEILNLLTNQTNLSKGDAENLRTQIIEQSYIIGNATEILYPDAKWDFSYALFFSTTVITTIGYGTLTPKTNGGQVFFIFYAIFGIPLCLLFYTYLGKVLKDWADLFFNVNCCADKYFGNQRCRKQCCEYEKDWTACCCYTIRTPLVKVFLIFLFIVAFFMLIPSWIVHKSHLESWSFLEGVYFAVTTLTTVGLGDFYPARSTIYYQLASSGWLWIGLALVSTLLQVASDYQKLFGEKVAKCLCVCCRKRRYEAIQTAPAFYKRLN